VAVLGRAPVPDIPVPTEPRGPDGVVFDGGVWRRPMAETLLRRFLRAPKAEDWGRSMRRP
jgi:hypothetical protein